MFQRQEKTKYQKKYIYIVYPDLCWNKSNHKKKGDRQTVGSKEEMGGGERGHYDLLFLSYWRKCDATKENCFLSLYTYVWCQPSSSSSRITRVLLTVVHNIQPGAKTPGRSETAAARLLLRAAPSHISSFSIIAQQLHEERGGTTNVETRRIIIYKKRDVTCYRPPCINPQTHTQESRIQSISLSLSASQSLEWNKNWHCKIKKSCPFGSSPFWGKSIVCASHSVCVPLNRREREGFVIESHLGNTTPMTIVTVAFVHTHSILFSINTSKGFFYIYIPLKRFLFDWAFFFPLHVTSYLKGRFFLLRLRTTAHVSTPIRLIFFLAVFMTIGYTMDILLFIIFFVSFMSGCCRSLSKTPGCTTEGTIYIYISAE